MRIYDIITKKKHGGELTEEEIRFFVNGFTDGSIPDYQISPLLMAICLKGMTDKETFVLTDAIQKSGDSIDLSEFGELSVDKHSTGGVGDKTTLIVAPIVGSLGCKVAKMSGRGLGHTGGTVDKLESFPGYDTSLSPEAFFEQVRKCGISVIGQSGNLAPADKKLYALRDVTATVDSIPLITSSIMGKKLAAGSHNIVLDVKCGSGAFMKTADEAKELAEKMVDIGIMCGRNVAALITNMDIPLGHAVGNILEVKEAMAVLRGEGPDDLLEVCTALASLIAHLSLKVSLEDARLMVKDAISSGRALAKFKEWIVAQGGDGRYVDNPELWENACISEDVLAPKDGYISHINAEAVGLAGVTLGAGRATKDDEIDFSAGIILHKKTGEFVKAKEVIATLYTNRKNAVRNAKAEVLGAIEISDAPVEKQPLIYETVKR